VAVGMYVVGRIHDVRLVRGWRQRLKLLAFDLLLLALALGVRGQAGRALVDEGGMEFHTVPGACSCCWWRGSRCGAEVQPGDVAAIVVPGAVRGGTFAAMILIGGTLLALPRANNDQASQETMSARARHVLDAMFTPQVPHA